MALITSSLRTKLFLSFILVIIFGGISTLILGSKIVHNTVISQAQAKVRHDLSSARMIYQQKLLDIALIVDLTAARESLQDAILNNKKDLLYLYLSRVRVKYKLDILTLTDEKGIVLVRTRNPGVEGDDQSKDEIVKRALMDGTVYGTQIVSREELLKEGEDLAERALIKYVPTPLAIQKKEDKQVNGMMLKAAAPVRSKGKKIGVLYGGILLNRNYEIVDKVKEIVFKGEKYLGKDIGTSTIFQDDLRISTNVKDDKGERAIGTRLSEQVYTAVVHQGKAWIDRAFVVNEWYITAYEPIRNVNGKIIGILYVGMLEKPYIDTINHVMLTFVGIALVCVFLLLVILYFSTKRIIKPLGEMVIATQKIASGDYSFRVETTSKDEIGLLAESFNKMTEDLQKAHEELREWALTLEKKVEERTKELQEMQEHLIQSEKLASLGKLAAGIAHEINNPLGGILLYSHLLLEDLGNDSPYADNIKKIIKETTRSKEIVKGLLEFARPKEPEKAVININDVILYSLGIFEKQALFQNIRIKKDLTDDSAKIVGDASQLQQVFMNIILNAAEAMNGEGDLIVKTYVDGKGNVLAEITDTGCGISKENISRIFEPFFTTKPVGKGTGLGLAISYSIIKRHGGDIRVKSEEGKGTTFTISLPMAKD
jgi:two-component system NtrC family sensor kinase